MKMCPWNRKIKIYLHGVLILHYKTGFFNINVSISWLVSHEVFIFTQIFFWRVRIKRRSKVQEKNMSCEQALDFDQWKTFSENNKPIRVMACLQIYQELLSLATFFSEFIQTQKRYPTSLDKMLILTWKLLVISS